MINKIKTSLFLFYLLLLLFLSASCQKDQTIISDNTEEPPKYSKFLKGNIELENQNDHSNALLYIDRLDIGTSSDSSGFFSFEFSEADSVYSGMFTIYYYLADYEMDSARFVLEKGQVVNDSLDVGSEGLLETRQLKQLIFVDGSTDRYEYAVGDTLFFTARIKNVSDETINIRIVSGIDILDNAGLYNDKYPGFPFIQGDATPVESYFTLYKNQLYQESRYFIVPEGCFLADGFFQIPSDKYIVSSITFEIIRTTNPITKTPLLKRIKKFIRFKWYGSKLPVRHSPELDLFPNKYEYPIVFVKK